MFNKFILQFPKCMANACMRKWIRSFVSIHFVCFVQLKCEKWWYFVGILLGLHSCEITMQVTPLCVKRGQNLKNTMDQIPNKDTPNGIYFMFLRERGEIDWNVHHYQLEWLAPSISICLYRCNNKSNEKKTTAKWSNVIAKLKRLHLVVRR